MKHWRMRTAVACLSLLFARTVMATDLAGEQLSVLQSPRVLPTGVLQFEPAFFGSESGLRGTGAMLRYGFGPRIEMRGGYSSVRGSGLDFIAGRAQIKLGFKQESRNPLALILGFEVANWRDTFYRLLPDSSFSDSSGIYFAARRYESLEVRETDAVLTVRVPAFAEPSDSVRIVGTLSGAVLVNRHAEPQSDFVAAIGVLTLNGPTRFLLEAAFDRHTMVLAASPSVAIGGRLWIQFRGGFDVQHASYDYGISGSLR